MIKIINMNVEDVRFPTSKDLTGSDAIHTDPDYSATYVTITTSDNNLIGYGLAFTLGKGNDIVAECIKHFFPLFNGLTIDEIEKNIGKLWYDCADHSQLRWLGPEKGVVHMALAAIFNALWDLIAKKNEKPLWQFVVESKPETIMSWLTFKNIEDVLTKDDAFKILTKSQEFKKERTSTILKEGYPSYTTAAGWLGYSDEKIVELCQKFMSMGWKHFKIKVGLDLEADVKRLALIRQTIGDDCSIMVDANQQWSVEQSIKHINAYKQFNLLFVEEPISPDDVLGFTKIKKAVGDVRLATGEACGGRVMFKQFLESGAMNICQIDSCRLGSINEILTVLLMAHKLNVPVFPHAGGVGLCEYVQHLCMIDYVLINGEKDNKVVEYMDSLHEHFIYPCNLKDSHYMPPLDHGYSVEMKEDSINTYSFPNGKYWSENQ
jgi:L-fuconate dehydratase|tara:strand:- start:1219 stop:2520 length:1302 start_codon:yes stop_codon:yes gene_type:complete